MSVLKLIWRVHRFYHHLFTPKSYAYHYFYSGTQFWDCLIDSTRFVHFICTESLASLVEKRLLPCRRVLC